MTNQRKGLKIFNVVLWLVQTLLAIIFIWAGAMKLFQPEELPWPWVNESPGLATISGVFDLLAGLGVVLPALLRIQPGLTVNAAYGIIALMIAACGFHIMRGEGSQVGVNIFIMVCAIFIIWGRLKKAPIQSRRM